MVGTETFHINNEMEDGMPYFRIMWQGLPDITNKVENEVKSNQYKNQTENNII